jgi:hypothetical protein
MWGCLRKILQLSGVIDTAKSTLHLNIFVNCKLFGKMLQGVEQEPKGRCFMKKIKGQKSCEIVPTRDYLEKSRQAKSDQ